MPTSSKLNILHIITGLEPNGAEMMLFRLLESTREDLHCAVISLTGEGELGGRIRALGVPVISLRLQPGFGAFLSVPLLVREIRIRQPDLIQTWMYHANLIGGIAACIANRPIVWAIHHSNLDFGKNKIHTLLTAYLSSIISTLLPKAIIYCSRRSASIHQNIGYSKRKSILIPNGFDLSLYRPDHSVYLEVRAELGLREDCPLIGIVARFDPQKNHKGFIAAARIVLESHPETQFLMCGPGVDWNNKILSRWIDESGLRSKFILLGNRRDVPRLMSALDILASSSFGEAFSNVIGEAMACGVPCVATDVGDSAWMIGDTGRVVAPGDKFAFASALCDLLNMHGNERIALGDRARQRIAENFAISYVAQIYIQTYRKLTSCTESA